MKNIALTLVLGSLVSGCSIMGGQYEVSRTSPTAELMTVDAIVTPTRVLMSNGPFKYQVDLAYFYPSTVMCSEKPKACQELSDLVLNKQFWVEREYDRYGLPMHTLWPASETKRSVQPVNIELLVHGGYSRMADTRDLPNGKSELVERAADLGLANYRLSVATKKLPFWQQDYLKKAKSEGVKGSE